jgi:hypothetical protein
MIKLNKSLMLCIENNIYETERKLHVTSICGWNNHIWVIIPITKSSCMSLVLRFIIIIIIIIIYDKSIEGSIN